MILFDLDEIVHLLDLLPTETRFHDFTKAVDPGIRDIQIDALVRVINRLQHYTAKLELNATLLRCEELRSKLARCRRNPAKMPAPGTMSSEALHIHLTGIKNAVGRDIALRCFLYIPREKARYFERDELFGKEVGKVFPGAVLDIKEAGNCFATGRYTAAVFHVMRTVEHGLRALARKLNVKVKNTDLEYAGWQRILDEINAKIDALARRPGRRRKKMTNLEFYKRLELEIRAFKDAFRNAVMHSRALYDEQEALGNLNHVREFMQRLASKLKKPSKLRLRRRPLTPII